MLHLSMKVFEANRIPDPTVSGKLHGYAKLARAFQAVIFHLSIAV